MSKALILHIETATDVCSVALSQGDQQLSLVESGQERSHAILLNQFIRRAMDEAGFSLKQLDGVAVSKGPGSYTGLRIGVSTSKGLAYALDIPLLASGTLENMAHGVLTLPQSNKLLNSFGDDLLFCPMLDARRMEVYSGFYTRNISQFREVSADIIDGDSYREILNRYQVCFFGNGAPKCKDALSHPNAHFLENIEPSAGSMIGPILKKYRQKLFEDVAYFEPFYLKDFIATVPKKKVL